MTNKASGSIYDNRIRITDIIINLIIYLSAAISSIIVIGIIIYVGYRGIKVVDLEFLTTTSSAIKGTTGIAGNIINTIYLIVITLIIAVPIGIGAAIYLNEYAKPGKVVRLIEFTTDTLSGIPSIIFGLFGMVFFGGTLKLGYSILAGAFTLVMMVIPLIIRNTQSALETVPGSYKSAALGMGATKWYMIRTVLLPSAKSGIITGIILSIGRIVSESAALLFTAGSADILPQLGRYGEGLFSKIFQSGGSLTIGLYLSMEQGKYNEAFGIAWVLIVIVLGINIMTRFVASKFNSN